MAVSSEGPSLLLPSPGAFYYSVVSLWKFSVGCAVSKEMDVLASLFSLL